ncbi:hypothetical protein [Alteriqipengyuania sp.]|uniref:hypothetical protein n=1 Tax=Alteriqipengyuania sp. TaxID=2800692 RepID=UPI00351872D2
MLALGTTPALAQDASSATTTAQPTQTTVPTVSTAPPPITSSTPAPAPETTQPDQRRVVLPPSTTAPSQSTVAPAPVVDQPTEPVQETPRSTEAPAAASESRSSASSRTARTSAATRTTSDTAPVTSTPTTGSGETTDLGVTNSDTMTEAAAPVATRATVEPEAMAVSPQADESLTITEIVSLALMGLVPIGILALLLFAFARRRKRANAMRAESTASANADVIANRQSVDQPRTVTVMPASTETRTPSEPSIADGFTGTSATITPVAAARMNRRDDFGGLPHTGASVALPAKAPESAEEREALLKRMTDAKPDRANPFTARKARRHRAKLILASLGRKFESGPPKMDLSQYPNNWPALATRSDKAAA